jgi:hypothetical protein
MLAATSAEPDSGKSTLVVVLGHVTPRFMLNVEVTGPSLYRYVDQHKPTMVLDEADDVFQRRSDLKHIINAGWTRGAKVPRQEKIRGVWQTVWFDPFTPKAIALLGHNLPKATRSRCIELRMLPPRADEPFETFNQLDDPEFAVLRQKLCRWVADHVEALKKADPIMPASVRKRAAANWKLLLAIADLAGGPWPAKAREAAERLTRGRYKPSDGIHLLEVCQDLARDRKMVTSEDLAVILNRDLLGPWANYNHGGPITQRQIAILLEQYDIAPKVIHPTGRSGYSPRGYEFDEQFADAFARFLPSDPHIRTPPKKPPTKPTKRRK